MINLRVKLIRHWHDFNQSTGTMLILDNDTCQPVFGSLAIERGDRNNLQNVSRVPAGIYPLVFEFSDKFQRYLWELKDIPNRTECKIHPANYWNQLNGCISLGLKLIDINKDGYYDLTNSANTIKSFNTVLKHIKITTIEIIDDY